MQAATTMRSARSAESVCSADSGSSKLSAEALLAAITPATLVSWESVAWR